MIQISNLKKSYGGDLIIDDFSLTVSAPIFGFLGQNGAGKTTIMKMAVGLATPDSGTITVGGESPVELKTREKIGFMPEAPYFYDKLTGLEFLEFSKGLFSGKEKSTAELEELLRKVGIYEARNHPIYTYSKGMKQRLGFAQALVNDPEYIFLDEPLDGLDPLGRKEIKAIIRTIKAEGRKVFFNSHILYDIEELCDEMGIVNDGKLLYAGSIREFCAGKSLEERFVLTIENFKRQHEHAYP